jgi:hypothetical protein
MGGMHVSGDGMIDQDMDSIMFAVLGLVVGEKN